MDDLLEAFDKSKCWDPSENLASLQDALKTSLVAFEHFDTIKDSSLLDHLNQIMTRYRYYQRNCQFNSVIERGIEKFERDVSAYNVQYKYTLLIALLQSMYVDRLILFFVET
jgi:hypothetical protein